MLIIEHGHYSQERIDEMVSEANANTSAMARQHPLDAAPALRWLSTEASVIFGMWQDYSRPFDVGIGIVRGQAILEDIVAKGKARGVATAYVRFDSEAQATRAWREFGDGRLLVAGVTA